AKFFNLSGWGSGNPELEIKERLKGLLNPGYLRKCGEPVTALLKLALQREIPERVDIFTGRLADHLPFRLLEELIKADPSHKEFNEFSLNEDDRTVRQASKAAGYPVRHPWEEVRDWVTNAGIPEERVRVVLDYQELRPEDYTDGTVWIVGDRHLLEKPFFTRRLEERFKKEPWSTELVARARDAAAVLFSNATILRLPIETFASDLVKQTLIELDPDYVQHMFEGVAGLVTQIVERKMPLTPPNS
ncbi:MAG: hypothetical protein J5J00_14875, partial [Deltaproteobacteria bacterium]|nr:hypothetical protein [Deltaproteobacteria bacterium]